MKRPKLYDLLQLLDDAELKRLYKFLRSPYYNYTPSVVAYYEAIRKYHPAYDSPKLAPEKLWVKIFPDKPFHELTLWQLSGKFAKLVKKYLATLEMEHIEGEEQRLYIKALGRRNGYTLFKKETFDALKALDGQPFRDEQYFTQKAGLLSDYFSHSLTPKRVLDEDALPKAMECTDRAFILAKLRMSIGLKGRERMLNTTYQYHFLKEVLERASDADLQHDLPTRLYSLLHRLFETEKNDTVFFEMKEKLVEGIGELRREDKSVLLMLLINYAVSQVNRGKNSFYREALGLYKVGLKTGLVMENKRIDDTVFGNIVFLACSAEETSWAMDFVKSHSKYLDRTIREDTIVYCVASIHYFNGDHQETVSLLNNHRFSSFDQMKVRVLICRAAFDAFIEEPDYIDFLDSQIHAFEKFLRRESLHLSIRKQDVLNFLGLLKKLINFKIERKTSQEYKGLEEMIRREKRLSFGREWLLKRLR